MRRAPTTFIYALIDPRDSRVRYVGKSDNPEARAKNHVSEAATVQRHGKDPSAKQAWLLELAALGLHPEMRVLEEVKIRDQESAERRWIDHFRTVQSGMTNAQPGGGGDRGRNQSHYGGGVTVTVRMPREWLAPLHDLANEMMKTIPDFVDRYPTNGEIVAECAYMAACRYAARRGRRRRKIPKAQLSLKVAA